MPTEIANIDELIESYDVQNDPILEAHFKSIEKALWQKIENYGCKLSQHLVRTSAIGMQFITKELGFSEKAGRNFYDANLLQDLGKTHPCYDPNLWQTPHRPTPEEREEKREHTRLGVELLDLALIRTPEELQIHPHIRVIQSIQQHHHERIDGNGYEGLPGHSLGEIVKAICIVDAFDGDMVYRPHQMQQRTSEEALERMKTSDKYSGAFDKVMLERFIDFQRLAS